MITSVIRHRVADFLKQHAPFDALSQDDLLHLAGSGKVKFHESDEYLFQQGQGKSPFLWVIQQGRVELVEESPTGIHLRDVLGEGDMPGLEGFVAGASRYSARTATDVILYGIATDVFESMVARYPAVQRFLAAQATLSGNLGFHRTSWLEAELPPVEFLRARLVTLPAGVAKAEAASRLIGAGAAVAALVDEVGCPVGTITALELLAAPEGAARLAARPCPPAVSAQLNTRSAVREMLRSRAEEIALTADGTPASRLEAIVTASELALFCGHDPARLLRAIRQAASSAEITPLIRQTIRTVREGVAQPQDIDDCCRIGAEMMAAICHACIRLAENDLIADGIAPSSIPYCWVVFGAAARGDLLDPVLPTLAVLYDDSDEAFQPEDRIYFTALTGGALSWLHACDLADPRWQWPRGAQPGMPISEWKRLYSETIRNPLQHDLYARREFFDVTLISGEASLLSELENHILDELRESEMAIALLANDTLANIPPLTFFRGMVLDMDGVPHDSFDIAASMISPLANAARVLAVAKRRLRPVNTLERLENALVDFPEDGPVLRQAAGAFCIGLYYQSLAGSARIDPAKLGKFDQLLLKTAFASIQRFLEFAVSAFVPSAK